MNYEQALAYLFSSLPMFGRSGLSAMRKDLTNIRYLCEAMHHPQNRFHSIHIAGTNGKGSVSHMLAAALQSNGYRTGLYTSPHLVDFRERIRVNGQMVPKEFVTAFTERIKPLAEEIRPSFFEISVAMAFAYFAEVGAEIVVVETGLGGRLDSTNIITPILSVITNISFDHMNVLGDTLPQIAAEKAGIIKARVPVVVGESQAESDAVFMEKASAESSPLSFADKSYLVTGWNHTHSGRLEVELEHLGFEDRKTYQLDLVGQYQTKNLVTVMECIRQLSKLGIRMETSKVVEGLAHTSKLTGLHGRWEKIGHDPDIILEVAHNEAGMKQVAAQLEVSGYDRYHIIIGMVKDKDVEKALSQLPTYAIYYFTQAQIPRALNPESLAGIAEKVGLKGQVYADVHIALKAALAHAHAKDLILVCGSVFLVGELGPMQDRHPQ